MPDTPGSEHGSSRSVGKTDLLVVLGLAILPVLLYLAGSLWLASIENQPLSTVHTFDPEHFQDPSLAWILASTLAAIGAFLFLFAAPGWLGILAVRGLSRKGSTAPAWSFAINTAALLLVCLILRQSVGIDRGTFVFGWIAWILILSYSAHCRGQPGADCRECWKRYGHGILWGLATIAAGFLLFWKEHLIQCFEGDGTEYFELARSLRFHFLPYWEIEATGGFGAPNVNPALITSYWTFAVQLLLGENEFATRLPFWVYWLGIFLLCCRLQTQSGQRSAWAPLSLALAVILSILWFTFYTGYSPYLADPANLGVPDALFTLLLLLAFDCLQKKDCAGWITILVLSSLVLYAGPVMFTLVIAAAWVFQPVARKRVLRSALGGGAAYAVLIAALVAWGWRQDFLEGWKLTFQAEYVIDYFSYVPLPRLLSAFLFLGFFLLGCGVIPALSFPRAFGRSAWERTVVTVTLAYLLIVLCSAHKNLHYLGPLVMIPVLLWGIRRPGERSAGKSLLSWLTPLSLCICIALCWPPARPIFTLNRELGARTTFQTDSYETACAWARQIPDTLYGGGILGWAMSKHTWIKYSALEARPIENRPLLVTDRTPNPDDYPVLILKTPDGVGLFARNREIIDWMRSRRSIAETDRFPRVFSLIAKKPPPHN